MGYTLTYNGVKSKRNKSFPLKPLSSKQVALLLGCLDPEDRISLEKLIGKGGGGGGGESSPLQFLTSKAIFEPRLEFRVSYKGGSKLESPFGSLKKQEER